MSDINPQTAWQPFEPSKQQPWTTQRAAHLLRRCGFGGTIAEISQAKNAGPTKSVAQLFQSTDDSKIEKEMLQAGRLVTGGVDSNALASWWLLRMIKTPSPFLEKMTLFWHGHFATGGEKVKDSRAMFRQNQLLRKYALAKFEPFVKNISRDVAMLIYLDSEENRKTRPNENYARELMELFCLGVGNYTETDIKEVARCFTGCEIRKNAFAFNEYQHDNKMKTVFGETGNFDSTAAIEIVLKQKAAPLFIAKKLIRYFVFDDQPISNQLAQPIADSLRKNHFEIGPAVRQILSSKLFYSEHSIGKKIKSPVELAIGFLRFFEASTNINQLSQQLVSLGQLPLYPPNVKGWPGGRKWINASTILARANLIAGILKNPKTKYRDGNLEEWVQSHSQFQSDSLQWAEDYLFAVPLSAETKSAFQQTNPSNREPERILSWLSALPEFQLC
ncbi:MAG: DUF1800 domain-containing protein [Mariniblastus sp.]|nr:DUF1800 domain-containing protein [Mariniblastus sp.]